MSADIQYFAVSNRVYFLSNNVGIHFLFTYYFPIRSFRLVPMFSGSTPYHCSEQELLAFSSLITHYRNNKQGTSCTSIIQDYIFNLFCQSSINEHKKYIACICICHRVNIFNVLIFQKQQKV